MIICGTCDMNGGTVWRTISGLAKLAQCHYTLRRDNVAMMHNWEFCENHRLQRAKTWYEQNPQRVTDNENCKILSDAAITGSNKRG